MWTISNYLIYFTANIPLHIKRQDLLSTPRIALDHPRGGRQALGKPAYSEEHAILYKNHTEQ